MESLIKKLRHQWEGLANADPFWAILTNPEKKGRKWKEDDFFQTGEIEIDNLIDELNKKKIFFIKGSAIDFGCGVGRLTQPMGKYFESVLGIDISEKMVKLAEENNNSPNCKFITNQTSHLGNIKDKSVDFIYSNIVLQHIYPPLVFEYLNEFERVVKRNGILVFQLPDRFINRFLDLIRNNPLSQKWFYRMYLKVKFGSKPKMETYRIRKEKVINYLEKKNISLISLDDNRNAGPKWISYTYYCRKR